MIDSRRIHISITRASLFLLAILLLFAACPSSPSTSESNNELSNLEGQQKPTIEALENGPTKCETITGRWKVFEREYEIENEYSESRTPLGLGIPDISLSCDRDEVKGQTLRFYDSRKGKPVFANLEGRFENNRLTLSLIRSSDCSVEYVFSNFESGSMSGLIVRNGCKVNKNKITRVLALRSDDKNE